jgi:hypothetical protein
MSQTTRSAHAKVPQQRAPTGAPQEETGWVGMIAFGGMMMILLGFFHAMAGFVALFQEEYFLVGANGLMVTVDYTAWGWTHLILGALVLAAGIAVLAGQMWARVVTIVVAMASALVNLAFLAAHPVWSMMMIALDVLVIWAVTVHGSEMKAPMR